MASLSLLAVLVCIILVSYGNVQATSSGALSSACTTITPGHGGSSQTIPGGFLIYSDLVDDGGNYQADTAYTIRLEGNVNFKGFLIQARASGTTNPIGAFSGLPSGTKHLSCSGMTDASVTHSNANYKTSVSFTWTSPSTAGTVEFRYAVVRNAANDYFANINAADFRPVVATSSTSSSSVAPTTTVTSSSTVASSSVASSSVVSTSTAATSTIASTSSSSSSSTSSTSVAPTNTPPAGCPGTNKNSDSAFPIVFRQPDGCEREDCTLYWAMGPNNENSNYLDIYMEGDVEGWMALGFSQNTKMISSDVLGCRVVSGNVEVIDTWNIPVGTNNVLDASQDGVCPHLMEYSNSNRLKCLFSRSAAITDINQDFNLNDQLYIIRGFRDSSYTGSSLNYHTETPIVTSQTYNPLQDNNTALPPSSTDCPTGPSTGATYPVVLGNIGDDYYFASRINDENSDYIDIILQGNADGWVAVGFSETNNMFSADVLACKRESSSDTVNVIDTWNSADTRSNRPDASQAGICQHSASYVDGRISCTFSRLIKGSDDGDDLNLNATLYQMYSASGSGRGSSASGLLKHSTTPTLSDNRLSLASDALTGRELSVVDWPKKPLIQTHGVLMILSWILFATTGIFFASWMKPILPNGEWFQTHRALMLASLFTGVIGFIFAFIAHARNTEVAGIINFQTPSRNTKIVHFAFGWIIILFHIANPLIAIFRCAPGKPRRWIFNLIHGDIIGSAVEIIALTNVGMGIYLIEESQGSYSGIRALIAYIIFVVIMILVQLAMFIVYTYKAMKAPEEDRDKLMPKVLKCFIGKSTKSNEPVKMSELGKEKMEKSDKKSNTEPAEKLPKKKPVEDAPVMFSWISAAIYMVTVIVTVLILIILIAIL